MPTQLTFTSLDFFYQRSVAPHVEDPIVTTFADIGVVLEYVAGRPIQDVHRALSFRQGVCGAGSGGPAAGRRGLSA